MLWYSLEAPRRGASNEYPQHMLLCRTRENRLRTVQHSSLTKHLIDIECLQELGQSVIFNAQDGSIMFNGRLSDPSRRINGNI